MPRLPRFGLTFSVLLALSCCGSMPTKPQVDLCTLDIPASEGSCARTGTQNPPYRIPITRLDHATAFSQEDWKLIKDYIDELEAYAKSLEQSCGSQK